MPPYFNQPEMNSERMCRWADKIGPSTRTVVDRIFESVRIQEQAYNSVLAVLKLEKTYSGEALESACRKALELLHSPRYRHLKPILSHPVTQNMEQQEAAPAEDGKGLVRGASYYGGGNAHAQ